MAYEWRNGELAFCITAYSPWFRVGGIYSVDQWIAEGRIVPATGRRAESRNKAGLISFYGVPHKLTKGPESWGWEADRFRPLNEDDEKCIREKHGNLVRDNIGLGSWK